MQSSTYFPITYSVGTRSKHISEVSLLCMPVLAGESLTVHILHPSKLTENWLNILLRAPLGYHSPYKHVLIHLYLVICTE